ncbi:MAG: HesA/MoeB/ThiF family protein [Pseudomonadota bacterium]
MLSDEELERYSRQLMLADFSIDHQESLARASVLIVGCGGLGHPLAVYLAGAGVGRLVLADGDHIELSNLPRQFLFQDTDLGASKAEALARRLTAGFPSVNVEALARPVSDDTLAGDLQGIDLIADCSDNYPTRFALNRAAIAAALPLVSASAVRAEGQLTSFHAARGTPCYRCLYPDSSRQVALSCRESGVLGPVVGTLGALQALEVIKLITGWGEALLGVMLYMDLRCGTQQRLKLARRNDCPDCADVPVFLAGDR